MPSKGISPSSILASPIPLPLPPPPPSLTIFPSSPDDLFQVRRRPCRWTTGPSTMTSRRPSPPTPASQSRTPTPPSTRSSTATSSRRTTPSSRFMERARGGRGQTYAACVQFHVSRVVTGNA